MRNHRIVMMILECMLMSCAGERVPRGIEAVPRPPYTPFSARMENGAWTLVDYAGKSEGRQLPAWISAWMRGGETEIEALPEYSGRFCFVIEQSGPALSVLEKWAAGIPVERGFSRAVVERILRRWTSPVSASPDSVYGSYFEKMLKAVSAAVWQRAETAASGWILARYNENALENDDDIPPPQGEVYRMFVLACIGRTEFQTTLSSLYAGIPFGKSDSRAQINACEQMLGVFWTGF